MTLRTGDRQLIKELNIALVMNVILQHSPISRVEIAERTTLGRSTVTGIIGRLLSRGLVEEIGSAESASGRKPVLLTFNRRSLYAIGIKIAPRSATVALVDLQAEVLQAEEVALNPTHGVEEVAHILKRLIGEITARTGISQEKLLGVGIAMPGVIDPTTGTAITSYFLGWADLPVRDLLEQEFDLPVYVDNDANAMALAEALYGAGRGAQDVLGVTLGVGIGAGIVLGGHIHHGQHFNAGELGHTCVVRGGPACACGRSGCLEAVAADAAIVRRARAEAAAGRTPLLLSLARGHSELISRELVADAAKAGEKACQEVLAESGRWLGIALGNVMTFLNPSRIVVGGEAILQAGDLILGPLKETMREVVYPTPAGPLPVVQAGLGRHAWVQGAAALVVADAFRVPLHDKGTVAVASRVGQN